MCENGQIQMGLFQGQSLVSTFQNNQSTKWCEAPGMYTNMVKAIEVDRECLQSKCLAICAECFGTAAVPKGSGQDCQDRLAAIAVDCRMHPTSAVDRGYLAVKGGNSGEVVVRSQNFEDFRRTLVPRNHNGQNWCDLPVEPKKKSYKDEFPPHSIIRCHEVTFVQSDFVPFSAAQDALEDGSADRNL